MALCAVIVLAGTVVRAWVAGAGWFYWDDLLLHGLAAGHPLPGPELLLTDHDGHLMPGGMALAWLTAHVAPWDMRMLVAQIAVLQLVAGAATARMLWVLLRGRPVLLMPLVLTLAIPLALPAATWWSAAVNALPLAAALALAVAATVRLAETARRRHAVGAVVATAAGLFFVEKSVLVPVVAALVLLGWWWTSPVDDDEAAPSGRAYRLPARTLWRRTRWMWAAQGLVLAAWAAVFAVAVGRIGGTGGEVEGEGPGPTLWTLALSTYRSAVVPTLAGGPWGWDRWHPGPPFAAPSTLAVVAGVVVCAAVLLWFLATRVRSGPVWLGAALYPLFSVLLVAVGRSGPETVTEIVQTLRYHAEAVVVFAAALALALDAPRRRTAPAALVRTEPFAVAGLVAVVVSSSSISTVTYRDTWAEQPSRDYFVPLLEALRDRGAPILDAAAPLEVLLPVTHPANRLDTLLEGVPGVAPVEAWTTDPVVIDAVGTLHPADVTGGRSFPPGPEPVCGHRIDPDGTRIALDGPLMSRDWVVQINHFADTAGTVAVRFDEGEEVEVPVPGGLSTVYARVEGAGTGVTVTPRDGVSDLCLGGGVVGVLVPR